MSPAEREVVDGLAALQAEGWLDAMRAGDCLVLEPGESPEQVRSRAAAQNRHRERVQTEPSVAEELSSADQEDFDLIGALGAMPGPVRTPECAEAAIRLSQLSAEGNQLSHAGQRRLAQEALRWSPEAVRVRESPVCPDTLPRVAGALLAVARYRAMLALWPVAPLHGTGLACSVPGLAGWASLAADEEPASAGPSEDVALQGDYPPAYARDSVAQYCWRGVAGLEDGCEHRGDRCRLDPCPAEQPHCGEPCELLYDTGAPSSMPSVVVAVELERAAMGCGSVGVREYTLRLRGGRWSVSDPPRVTPGNHGQ